MAVRLPILGLSVLLAVACQQAPTGRGASAPPEAVAAPIPATPDQGPLVAYLGDSLAAGRGLTAEEAFPMVVETLLEERGRPIRTLNAGVSGDTSAGGLARLDWVLRQAPDLVVVELGANDGLRGLDPEMTEANLRVIVLRTRAAGARVLLVGMKVPPNYGGPYARQFEEVYPRLATELGVPLMPFLLAGVAGEPNLNLADGIHPNPAGHRHVAANLLPYVEEILALGE